MKKGLWLLLLAGCGGRGPGASAPPLFVQDGLQGDDCVFLDSGLSLHRPGEGWSFAKGPGCSLLGPGGQVVTLESEAAVEGDQEGPEPQEWRERQAALEGQGYTVDEGAWSQTDPPARGRILVASRTLAKGGYDGLSEARGRAGHAQIRLYVRGTWKGKKAPALENGEPRLLLEKAFKEYLRRFEPLPPMVRGVDSVAIQDLLDRWTGFLNPPNPSGYLGCFHGESPALPLEKTMITKKEGKLFRKDFAPGVQPGPWTAKTESLLVDGSQALVVLNLARKDKTDRVLQEVRLKGVLRRDGVAWKIYRLEALP